MKLKHNKKGRGDYPRPFIGRGHLAPYKKSARKSPYHVHHAHGYLDVRPDPEQQ
jgi:hypothetical protein